MHISHCNHLLYIFLTRSSLPNPINQTTENYLNRWWYKVSVFKKNQSLVSFSHSVHSSNRNKSWFKEWGSTGHNTPPVAHICTRMNKILKWTLPALWSVTQFGGEKWVRFWMHGNKFSFFARRHYNFLCDSATYYRLFCHFHSFSNYVDH